MGHEKRPRVTLRPLHGIVLLDKASGPSSNTALQQVRFAVRAEKGGHTGALDPLASGMLPLCFGEASKVAGYLLGNLPWIKQNLSLLIVGIILVSLLPVMIGYLQHRRTA